jgi:hypothetical protein
MARALVLAIALALVPGLAPAQTLTSNPRAYKAYLRRQIDKDLSELYERSNELIAALESPPAGDRRRVDDLAEKLVDLSRDIWNNVQMQRPTRERPKAPRDFAPRPRDVSLEDAREARRLTREVARDVSAEWRSGSLDAKRRTAMLDKLERIEMIGRRIRADVK